MNKRVYTYVESIEFEKFRTQSESSYEALDVYNDLEKALEDSHHHAKTSNQKVMVLELTPITTNKEDLL